MKRVCLLVVLALAMLMVAALPAAAITGGELDGNNHPNVAMIVFYQPDGRFRCSATLASSTVLITAGHCTEGVLGKAIVTFDTVAPSPTPRAADDVGDGMSQTGYTEAPTGWLAGTPHAHPLWDGELQINDLHDVGVVVLDEPYTAATPAQLPPLGYLDDLKDAKYGLNKQVFEVVGYGVFFEKPEGGPQKPTAVSDRTRRFTTAVGQSVSSHTLKLNQNENDSKEGGGTCFGDSGGPVFHGGFIVGDTSWGGSQFCKSVGGFYRLDIADARSFLDDYITVP
ncbi:MAG: trypsin-like serine protease [Actinomycetota bacterium]